jgi:hypothetical protein
LVLLHTRSVEKGIDIGEGLRKKTDLQPGETQQEFAARLFSESWGNREISRLSKPTKKQLAAIKSQQETWRNVLLKSLVMAVQSAFDAEQKEKYLRGVSNYFKQKLKSNYTAKPEKTIPESVISTVRELAGLHSSVTHPEVSYLMSENAGRPTLDLLDFKLCCEDKLIFPIPPERVESGLETYRKFLRFQVTPPLLLQNQIAVDSKKSATPADSIAIAQYRNLCHRTPNYLQDKKLPDIYLEGKVIEPNGYSLKESIIQTLNPLLQASKLEARPFYQFRNLFPESEPGDRYYYTPEQYNTCREVKAAFDSLFNRGVASKMRLATEKGPYLTARTSSGIDVEITNVALTKYPNRFQSRESLEVLLVDNNSSSDPTANSHKTCVLAKTIDSFGSDKWMKIGTLAESSRQLLNVPQEIAEPIYLKLQNVRAVQALTETECNLLFSQAAQLAETFQIECNLTGETDAMAAATWHLCCAPELNAGSRQKTQNFAFAAWGSQIAGRLNELQFKELTVGELNGAGVEINSCIKNAKIRIGAMPDGGLETSSIESNTGAIELDGTNNSPIDNFNINEKLPGATTQIEPGDRTRTRNLTTASDRTNFAKQESAKNSQIYHAENSQVHNLKNANIEAITTTSGSTHSPALSKRTLEIMKDGKYIAVGTISEKSAQLPIGTAARADLIPALAKTATIHLPGCDNPIKVGKVAGCDFGGQSSLSDREYTIAIQALNKPKYLLSTSGKIIGELDGDSIESLKKCNCLHDNFSFTASLTTYGTSNGTYTVAKSRAGNILCARKQNLVGHFKDFRFQGTVASVSVSVQQKSEICAAVATESGWKILGVFTPNQKESKIALMKAFCDRQPGKSYEMLKKEFDAGKLTGTSFKARIRFNSTTLLAAVDPSSIQYPTPLPQAKELDLKPPHDREMLDKARQVVAIVNSPPTLFYEFKKPTLSGGKITDKSGLGVAVSLRKAEAARQFFSNCKIEHYEVNPLDAFVAEETRRGYAVFHLESDSLPPKIMSSLVKQFGEPLAKDLSGGSPYFQKLRESPPLPPRAVFLLEKFYGIKNAGSSIDLTESSIVPESSIAPTENSIVPKNSSALENSSAPESSIISEKPQTIQQQNRNNSPMPDWEKNLIAAAVRAASDNNYSPKTSFMQNTLLATYCPESETITVIRARDNFTIYSRDLGEKAPTTICLSGEQKQFLESYKLPAQKEIQL